MRTHILTLCTLFCIGCDSGTQTDQSGKVGDSLLTYFDVTRKISVVEPTIFSPLKGRYLNTIKETADSVIRQMLEKRTISYTITHDTFIGDKGYSIYYEYFNSDSLVRTIRTTFSLPSPYGPYEFFLLAYEYPSSRIAFNKLDQVATIALTQEFGLNKEPAYVFRINNFLYWLSIPNRLHRSFDALKAALNYSLKTHTIDSMTNHYQPRENTGILNEGLDGKWHLKFVTSIYHSDTNIRAAYDHCTIEFSNNTLDFNGSKFTIKSLSKLLVPDVQTFFSYRELLRGRKPLHPKLSKFQGSVICYSIWINNILYTVPFNKSGDDNFIKFSDASFGFIADDKLYILSRDP